MDTYGEIKRKLRNIAAGKALIYEGEVKSVSGSTCTVDIGGVELADVRLTALPGETDILITPKVGSHVVLADLEGGTLRNLCVVQYGEVEQIQLNGGNNDGLVKINELTNKLNALVQAFNSHTHTVSGTCTVADVPGTIAGTASATSGQASQFNASDYKDDKITH